MCEAPKRREPAIHRVTADPVLPKSDICRFSHIRRTIGADRLLSDRKKMDVQRFSNVRFFKVFCHFRFVCLSKTTIEASDVHVNLCSTNSGVRQGCSQPRRAVLELLWAINTFIACSKMTGVADRAKETAEG